MSRSRLANVPRREGEQTMTTLVDRYYATLQRVGVVDFEHPDLEALRRQMSDKELGALHARLVAEGEATMREADALEKFGQRKFGVNDNSSSS
jgi:hypothetical protein